MSRIYTNPFQWGSPVSGTAYISRPEAQEHITTAMEKQLPLIITGRRGTGKTSLIKHMFSQSKIPNAYLDLSLVVCRGDLVKLILDAMEQSFPQVKTNEQFQTFRQQDSNTALAPILTLFYETVKASNQKFTLAWDEFHYLLKLKDDLIPELRENLREKREITHIFISHREDIMREIFDDHLTPFFYHREHLFLRELNLQAFEKFLTQRFRRMGLSDFDLAATVLEFTECQPQFTQQFAHALAQLWLQGTSTRLMNNTMKKMMVEQQAFYSALWDNFGLNERRLLLGLSTGYSRPTELGFIKQFKLSATSTAHNTVLKLLREGWLVNRDEGYHIYDPLFLKWLQQDRGLN